MNKETVFATKLNEIRELAKTQGNCVSEEQVIETFAELDLSGDQLQMVYEYLLQHKVGIGQPMDLDEFLSEEERDYLGLYLEEIAQIEALSDGELKAATMSAMAGDVQAQNRLIEQYLKDVPELAKLYAGQGVFLEDLIGEGNVALAIGVSMLGSLSDPEEAQGMLAKMMMDAMENHIKENADLKKADQKLVDKINDIQKKAETLYKELHRKVTVEELMEEYRISEKSIRDAIRMSGNKIEYIEG